MKPTTDSNLLIEAIRRALILRAGGAPDASAIADATVNIWHQMAERLTPIIGARGVGVLLGRSLHLTSKQFPWLAGAATPGSDTILLTEIKTRLAGNQSNAAVEASSALFTNFVELLTSLIGKSLTERLLSPVWGPPLPPSEKEKFS